MKDLGLMGESTFNLWCADVGLIPNGSSIDKTGWDFFVEFPFNALSSSKIHNSAKECKVQVKATNKRDKKLQFTLSNLRRLVTTPLPTFILFIEFNNNSHADDAFLVHIDDELSTQILRRIYELTVVDKNVHLNKKKMTIHYSDSHKLKKPNGEHLKELLDAYIGESFEDYISHKEKHIALTGYENGRVRMTFKTHGKDNLEKMIDSSLGMDVKFSVADLNHNNMRFGIIDNTHDYKPEDGIMQFHDVKPHSPCNLFILKDKTSNPIIFECNIYVSTINNVIPDEHKKIRVENELFDFFFKPHTGEANYTFYFDKQTRISLVKIKNALTIYKLMATGESKIHTKLRIKEGRDVDFVLNSLNDTFDLEEELETAHQLTELKRAFDFDADVFISLHDLTTLSNEPSVLLKALTNKLDLKEIRVEFTLDIVLPPQKKVSVLFFHCLPIGEYKFCTILSFIGEAKKLNGNSFELQVQEYEPLKKFVQTEIDLVEINNLLRELVDSYDDDYAVVVNYLDRRCD